MEENIDPTKENIINEDKPLETLPLNNTQKNHSNSIKKDSEEKSLSLKNENKNKLPSNDLKVDEVSSKDIKIKPKKEIPIEKKPFKEFISVHLLPSIIHEFKERGFEVNDINLKNTLRPIAGDKCWVIYCEIKDICNFWLSFEKEDISSLKSISLCKFNQKPSVIESFLIDEKRITLQLIISRILQRLNGQKLIGIN